MLKDLMTYKWVLIAWMMLLGGLLSPNRSYSQTMRNTSNVYTSTVDYQTFNQAAYANPDYRFQSTSAYTTVVGSSAYSSTISSPFAAYSPMGRPRRTSTYNPWDEEGDPSGDEMGLLNTPVGEPFVLLLMAMLYVISSRLRSRLSRQTPR